MVKRRTARNGKLRSVSQSSRYSKQAGKSRRMKAPSSSKPTAKRRGKKTTFTPKEMAMFRHSFRELKAPTKDSSKRIR